MKRLVLRVPLFQVYSTVAGIAIAQASHMTSSHTSSTSVSSEWWRPTRPMNWGQLFGKLEKTWPLMTRWVSFSDGSPKSSSSWSFPHAFMATLGARHVNPPSWREYIDTYRLDTFFFVGDNELYIPWNFSLQSPSSHFYRCQQWPPAGGLRLGWRGCLPHWQHRACDWRWVHRESPWKPLLSLWAAWRGDGDESWEIDFMI